MNKCDCYHIEEYFFDGFLLSSESECWGTRERDRCFCGGDRTKCDFYPEIQEEALREQRLKFGEWISVEDRLPDNEGDYLCYYKYEHKSPNVICENTYIGNGLWLSETNKITHWTLLPEPPNGEIDD